jgi:hypothetical protein
MSRERQALYWILAGGACLMLLGIGWGLPNVESWNGDDISPDKPLRVAADWWSGHHKYPYLHWWLNLALYAPYLAGLALAGEFDPGCLPKLTPGCFEHVTAHMTVLMVLTRLLSVAMGVGTVLATWRLANRLLGDERAAVWAAAVVAGSYPLVFFAHTGNLDLPHTFWFAASLVAAASVWQRGWPVDYAAFGLLAGCSVATKDSILGAYAGLGLALLLRHVQRARTDGRSVAEVLGDRRLWLLVALAVAVYGVSQNALFNFGGLLRHWDSWLEGGESLEALRARDFGVGRLAVGFATSLRAAVGLPVLGLALAGVAVAALRAAWRPALWLLAPAASYFALSIQGAGFTATRLVLPLVPIVAVFAAAAVAAWGAVRNRWLRRAGWALAGIAVAISWGQALNGDLRLLGDSRYAAEAWLRDHGPPGATIATFGGSDALPRPTRAGVEFVPIRREALRAELLATNGPAWLLLSSLHRPKRLRPLFDELRAGAHGYELAWEGEHRTPLDAWFSPVRRVGAVNPRLTLLRRRAQAPPPP